MARQELAMMSSVRRYLAVCRKLGTAVRLAVVRRLKSFEEARRKEHTCYGGNYCARCHSEFYP